MKPVEYERFVTLPESVVNDVIRRLETQDPDYASSVKEQCTVIAYKHEDIVNNLLPKIGSKVSIFLNSANQYSDHTVIGYYVWSDLNGSKNLFRVNILVADSNGYINARSLEEILCAP